jgi:hypothetical protein
MEFIKQIKSRDVYAILLLAVVPFAYYFPVTLGHQVFSAGDITWLFLPLRTDLARALAEGRLPLWTPSLQAGFPIFAEGEVAALYPLNLLLHRLLPAHTALGYTILFNLAWASIGMHLLARFFGFRITSALLAGFVFGFSGFMTAHLSHVPHLTVASWLPWLILFQQRYWRARQRGENAVGWFLVICFSITLQILAGFPQITLMNLGTFMSFGLVNPLLLGYPTGGSERERIISALRALPANALITFASILLGVALSAIQWLSTLELIGFSVRGQEADKSFFTSYSLDPAALTQLILPFWKLGEPQFGNMEYWFYLGMLPFCLALLAPLLRRDARTWIFVLLALLALSLALGGSNPLYEWLYNVPLLNRFRVPARFLLLFTFAMAFLAAAGLEALQDRAGDRLESRWVPRMFAAAFAVCALGVVGLAYAQPLEFWMAIWQVAPGILLLLSFATLSLARRRLIPSITFAVIVLGLTALDLAAFAAPSLTRVTKMDSPAELVQVSRTVLAMDDTQPIYRVVANKIPFTPAAVRAILYRNLPLTYGKQGVKSYLPSLGLWRNEKYIEDMSLGMWNLMNIRYYLLPLETPSFGDPVPLPFDGDEPYNGLTMKILSDQPKILPTRASKIEVTSYTDQTRDLPNGFLAGEILLGTDTGKSINLPLRLGIETADWAYAGVEKTNHTKPANALSFPAYLKSIGRAFDGHKYIARYVIAQEGKPIVVTAVGARSFLPGAGLIVERINLIDDAGRAVSLAALLQRNELSLAFRSHAAAMWENHSMLPRAFMVHAAEIVGEEDALARMKQPDFRPDQIVLLSDVQTRDILQGSGQEMPRDEIAITEYKPERVVVKARAEKPGYLVLTDSWYPGWEAFVDGESAPILRADYIFRAVALPPGEHTVVFEFRPTSVAVGAAISGLSLLLCGALVIWRWKVSR